MAVTSSCIVLIEDLKIDPPGVSAFSGAWAGDRGGGGEGGLSFTSGLGWSPCVGGLGGGVGTGLAPSFIGKLRGIDPKVDPGMGLPDGGVACGPAGGILICGLIGLGELDVSEGLVGSAMCEIVRELARMAQRVGNKFSTEHSEH